MSTKHDLARAISALIKEANELHATSQSDDSAPMLAGRATWTRSGILRSIRIVCEMTGICDYCDLLEGKQTNEEEAL